MQDENFIPCFARDGGGDILVREFSLYMLVVVVTLRLCCRGIPPLDQPTTILGLLTHIRITLDSVCRSPGREKKGKRREAGQVTTRPPCRKPWRHRLHCCYNCRRCCVGTTGGPFCSLEGDSCEMEKKRQGKLQVFTTSNTCFRGTAIGVTKWKEKFCLFKMFLFVETLKERGLETTCYCLGESCSFSDFINNTRENFSL